LFGVRKHHGMAFSLSPPSPPGEHDFFRVDCLAPLDYGMHMPKLGDRSVI
jgi:hypothetical protein